jgi:hypothetical protein
MHADATRYELIQKGYGATLVFLQNSCRLDLDEFREP